MCHDCNGTGRARETRPSSDNPYSTQITVYGPCWCGAGTSVEAENAASLVRDRAARADVEAFLYGKQVAA